MLCIECSKIKITVSNEPTKTLIRRYQNLSVLAASAEQCDFCRQVHEHPQQINDNSFAQCRELWGQDVSEKAWEQAAVYVYHLNVPPDGNIVWTCNIKVDMLDGYSKGPKRATSEGQFGGIYVDDASPISTCLAGRRVEAEPTVQTMIDRARFWLDDCKSNHDACTLRRTSTRILPTRILDVSRWTDGQPAPIIVHPKPGSTGHYIALSYTWGQNPSVLLKKHNFEEFIHQGVPYETLPRTFHDAITLTQALGFDYVWIDALCIIQDSSEDWDEQSARMFDVFSEADIVVRAGHGKDTSQGLFDTTQRVKWAGSELLAETNTGKQGTCFVRPPMTNCEPLDTRCWALQEFRLAQQAITFNSDEIVWDCRQTRLSESGRSVRELDTAGFSIPLRYPQDFATSKAWAITLPNSEPSHLDIWQRLVTEYTQRRLTLAKDKLPAMSGLAQHYAQHHVTMNKDRYLAGHWLSQLPASLLWRSFALTNGFWSRPDVYRAPTWSWASVDDLGSYGLQWVPKDSDWSYAQIKQAEVIPSGTDIYGQVKDGWLTIQAPLGKAELRPDKFYGLMWDLWPEGSEERYQQCVREDRDGSLGRVVFDIGPPSPQEDQVAPIYCLRITDLHGLALEPCENDVSKDRPQTWRRMGVFEISEEHVTWLDESQQSIVTIV